MQKPGAMQMREDIQQGQNNGFRKQINISHESLSTFIAAQPNFIPDQAVYPCLELNSSMKRQNNLCDPIEFQKNIFTRV